MFGMLESLAKAAVGVAVAPAAILADVVTLGGLCVDRDKPYTASVAENIMDNLTDAVTPK